MSRDLVPQSHAPGGLAPAALPAIIASTVKRGAARFFDFFTSNIRNPNTRRVYFRAAEDFFNWVQKIKVTEPRARAAHPCPRLHRGVTGNARGALGEATTSP